MKESYKYRPMKKREFKKVNEHIHFNEEDFEKISQDEEISIGKKMKWKDSNYRYNKSIHPYGNEIGYYDKRVSNLLSLFL